MKRIALLIILINFCIILGCQSGGSTAIITSPEDKQIVLPDSLPAKFIAVFMTTSSSFETAQDGLDRVTVVSEQAKMAGIQAVNLVVNWGDLEPTSVGITNFNWLKEMISTIHSHGLLCILRIYANTEGNWQAWPSFYNPVETFFVLNHTEVFPWDYPYQTAWESFQQQLADSFILSGVIPDAMQITLGGSFGEQVLGGYDCSSWNDAFNAKLFAAEKWHIDSYMRTLGKIIKTHIVMLNRLNCPSLECEDEVGLYALSKGVTRVQTNAGACFLTKQDYGPATCKLLKRFQDRGARICLEEESGNWSCNQVGLTSAISNRVDCIKNLQSTYNVMFSLISFNTEDLNDLEGIAQAKTLLGI
jgi:hypothetical protein